MHKAICTLAAGMFLMTAATFAQSASVAQPASLAAVPGASKIKISDKATGYASGLKIVNAVVTVDTSIRVSPKTAYLSIEFSGISGSSLAEIASGNNNFWVIDKNGKEVKITERFLKSVGGSMESSVVNYTVKIPFRLKTDDKNSYTVRYVFESKDKKKGFDVVTSR